MSRRAWSERNGSCSPVSSNFFVVGYTRQSCCVTNFRLSPACAGESDRGASSGGLVPNKTRSLNEPLMMVMKLESERCGYTASVKGSESAWSGVGASETWNRTDLASSSSG
ncbi:hypothetical protein HA466_0111550 [Hirschfeldia incana]|nr:hypothetical protein HA466_0111550 [Hirschfeldia incana]